MRSVILGILALATVAATGGCSTSISSDDTIGDAQAEQNKGKGATQIASKLEDPEFLTSQGTASTSSRTTGGSCRPSPRTTTTSG